MEESTVLPGQHQNKPLSFGTSPCATSSALIGASSQCAFLVTRGHHICADLPDPSPVCPSVEENGTVGVGVFFGYHFPLRTVS